MKTDNAVSVDLTPKVIPEDIEQYEEGEWKEKYNQLSFDQKILFETQMQTRLIKRIMKNILYFFWLSITGLILYATITYFVIKDNTPKDKTKSEFLLSD